MQHQWAPVAAAATPPTGGPEHLTSLVVSPSISPELSAALDHEPRGEMENATSQAHHHTTTTNPIIPSGELLLVGLLISLILVSIVGNCLVCVAIFTDRRLRKLGNAFIVSLAIADLFVSCLVMTFALCNDLMNYWIFGDWFCDVWISFDIMCCTASILNLCAISLDRFIHIKDCLFYNQWMTRRMAISAVIFIWFISALVSFVPINLGWHKPDHQFGGGGGGPAGPSAPHKSSERLLLWASGGAGPEDVWPLEGAKMATLGQYSDVSGGPNTKLDYSARGVASNAIENQSSTQQRQNLATVADLDARRGLLANSKRASSEEDAASSAAADGTPPSEAGEDFVSSAGGPLLAPGSSSGLDGGETGGATSSPSEAQFNQEARESNPQDGSQIGDKLNPTTRGDGGGAWQEPRLSHTAGSHSGENNNHHSSWPRLSPALDASAQQQPQQLVHQERAPDAADGGPRSSGHSAHLQHPQCMLTLTPTYAIISSTISFFIPCIIMLGLYTKLFACARRHVRNIQAISRAPAPIAISRLNDAGDDNDDGQQVSAVGVTTPGPTNPLGSRPPLKTWLKLKPKCITKTKLALTAPPNAQTQINNNDKSINNSKQTKNRPHTHNKPASSVQRLLAGRKLLSKRNSSPASMGRSGAHSMGQSVNNNTSDNRNQKCPIADQHLLPVVDNPDEANESVSLSATGKDENFNDQNRLQSSDLTQPPPQQQLELKHDRVPSEERRPFLNQTTSSAGAGPGPITADHTSAGRCRSCLNQQQGSTKVRFQTEGPNQQQSGQLATHKAAVTLGIIMGTFLVCWVPFFCLNIIKAFCVDCIPSSMFRAFTWLGYANSALNPIIYGIHNSEFRCAFNRIFFKHLNIKNSRYYLNRRFSYEQRHPTTAATNRRQNSCHGRAGNHHHHHHHQQQHHQTLKWDAVT